MTVTINIVGEDGYHAIRQMVMMLETLTAANPATKQENSVVTEGKAEAPSATAETAEKPKPARARKAKEETPNISTGEERVDPETAAQDEADETAETEAVKEVAAKKAAPETPAVTVDDLRAAMGSYAKKFGMAAATEDGAAIFNEALGPLPEGTKNSKGEVISAWALTAVPADKLDRAVTYWRGALAENPFARAEV